MQCPEVSEFRRSLPRIRESSTWAKNVDIASRVSLALPNHVHCPDSLRNILKDDTNYYEAENLPLELLVSEDFIESFVKQGHVLLSTHHLTINSNVLKVVVDENKAKESGIRFSERDTSGLVLLKTDLVTVADKASEWEKWKNFLKLKLGVSQLPVKFLWRARDETICPSSLAKFFCDSGASIREFEVVEQKFRSQDFKLPLFQDGPEKFSFSDCCLVRNLVGAVILGLGEDDLPVNGDHDTAICKNFLVVEFKGLLEPDRLEKLHLALQDLSASPWTCMTISLSKRGKLENQKKHCPLIQQVSTTNVYFPKTSVVKHFIHTL